MNEVAGPPKGKILNSELVEDLETNMKELLRSFYNGSCQKRRQSCLTLDLRLGASCFPVLVALMMALPSTETHDIALKKLALFRPKL